MSICLCLDSEKQSGGDQYRRSTEDTAMAWRHELAAARTNWSLLTFYQKFEHAVILLLTALIAIITVLAVWNLTLKVVSSMLSTNFDPTDYPVFQELFGTIFTVIIALEFKRSLLVASERTQSIVQVRAVILIALLAVVRKVIIIDLSHTDASQLFALAATILGLGGVYWFIRDQDRKHGARQDRTPTPLHTGGSQDNSGAR